MIADIGEVIHSENGVSVTINFKTDKKGSDKFVNMIEDLVSKINEPIVITPHDIEVKNNLKIT